MRGKRAELYAQNPNAPIALRDRFLAEIRLPANAVVAGYIGADHEIDPVPLMEALHARGYRLALPVIPAAKNDALIFKSYNPADTLTPGQLNIPEPISSSLVVEPDILLVPLLAFDSTGHRLGRGGGYYDRTLQNMRKSRKICAIGLAFSGQYAEKLPADSHDAKLDKIVTEIEVISVLNPC
jgi:5-formyltetrahydrofolate cyclo-ligase